MKTYFYCLVLLTIAISSLQAQKLSFYHQLQNINAFKDGFHIATSDQGNKEIPNICADGSVATLILYSQSSPMSSNFRLKIKEDLQNYTEQYGRIENLQFKQKENLLIAKYRHPVFITNGKTVDQLTLQVYKPGRGNERDTIVYETYINIFNAPVLALTSVFGKPESYSMLLPAIQKMLYPDKSPNGNYPKEAKQGLIFLGNFENTSGSPFKENENIIKRFINGVIFSLRKSGFIAGKVDLLTHGVSGLLARQWIQSREFQNNIKRLITINTPHSGTQLADLILSSPFFNAAEYPIRRLSNYDISEGAIENISVNSKVLAALNRSTSPNKVPSHTISGVDEVNLLDGYFGMALIGVAGLLQGKYNYLYDRCENQDKYWLTWRRINPKKYNALLPYYNYMKEMLIDFDDALGYYVPPTKILNFIFDYQQSDGFSVAQSQNGGLQQPFNYIMYRMPYHKALFNYSLIEHIPALLASEYNYNFSNEGFNPEVLNTKKLEELFSFIQGLHNIEISFIEKNENPHSIEALENESVIIMSPKGGDTFKPGETVQIVVNRTDSVSAICVSAIALSAPDNGTFSNYTTQKTATFNYKVPDEAVGPVKILIRGYLPVADTNATPYTKVDTVTINIIPQATLKTIEFDNEAINIVEGEKRVLRVFGKYSDNIKRDITNLLTNSNFKSEKSNVVSLSNKVAQGLKSGESEVTVTYNSLTAGTLFTVISKQDFENADTTLSVEVLNDNLDIFNNISNVSVFPNPSKGNINLEFELFKPTHCSLKITDINGRLIDLPIDEFLGQGKHSYSINLEKLNTGVYFYYFSDGISTINGKINLIK
ncbi:MAG: T9SS type A sorting domain-containing protein [Candidatus Kapabacteria bacterium]|nr:T9SS type A sorting domain-containing protein [Candidatus Kapabacteria bacterium]